MRLDRPSARDLLNDARVCYYHGDYAGSYARATRVGELLVAGDALVLDAPDWEYAVDAATLRGLSLRGLADHERAWRVLATVVAEHRPDAGTPEVVSREIRDDERRRNFVFGQLVLVELAAERLCPPDRVRALFGALGALVCRCERPEITSHGEFLRAWVLRLEGRFVDAVAAWLTVARDRRAEQPIYDPQRALCESALTLEALDPDNPDVDALLDCLRSADGSAAACSPWEDVLRRGLEARRGRRSAAQRPRKTDDAALFWGGTDAWFSGLARPSDADVAYLLRALDLAPPACRLVYAWRAARTLRRRGVRPPPALLSHLEDVLDGIPPESRGAFGIPAGVRDLLEAPDAVLTRCLAV